MKMSDSIAELAGALAKAQSEITGAKKGSDNPFFKSKYADLAACWDALREPLTRNGLTVIQTTKPDPEHITVVTTLAHSSGEWIQGELTMTPTKSDPQAYGSCLTYARRYSLAGITGLAQIDDDANSATSRSLETITTEQSEEIKALIEQSEANEAKWLKFQRISTVSELPADRFQSAVAGLKKKLQANAAA